LSHDNVTTPRQKRMKNRSVSEHETNRLDNRTIYRTMSMSAYKHESAHVRATRGECKGCSPSRNHFIQCQHEHPISLAWDSRPNIDLLHNHQPETADPSAEKANMS
ncbi:unnamed protein product, partial [Ectocarpus sp. 4 AP-2014]